MTMNLPLIVAILSFVFIVSYSPQKKKKHVEYYQPQPAPIPIPVHMCDEARYLNIQGLTPECSGGHPKEYLGAIYGR
jgi:hypothetical protein